MMMGNPSIHPSIHHGILTPLDLVFWQTQATAEGLNFYYAWRRATLSVMAIVVDYLALGVVGWMMETPSTHPSIDYLGSQFLFSDLADAPPLKLILMVVMCCI